MPSWYVLDVMTIDEFSLAYEGYTDLYREDWEKLRLQCYYSTLSISKPKQIQQFMPFSWDKEKSAVKKVEPDRAAFDRMVEKINRINKNSKKIT